MNFVFISPHFPENYWNFCDRLRANGVNVLGIGDAPYETLPALLKSALTEYYRVDNMENYDEMLRAMGFFTFKYGKIDWVESNNEYWLEQDARLRTDFNITTGIKSAEIEKFKRKSVMKTYYQKAGIPTARWCVTADVTEAQAFAKTVGWPVIAKPDNGVGANGTHKFKNKTELNKFFQQEGPNAANYILEEFVDGVGSGATHAESGVEGVGAGAQGGHGAQIFHAHLLFLQRILVRRAVAQDLHTVGIQLKGLLCLRGEHQLALDAQAAVQTGVDHLIVVCQLAGFQHDLQGLEASAVGQGDKADVLGVADVLCPAAYGDDRTIGGGVLVQRNDLSAFHFQITSDIK